MAFAAIFLSSFLLLCAALVSGNDAVSETLIEGMPNFVGTGDLTVSAPIEILDSKYVYGENSAVIRFRVPACSLHARAMKYFLVSKVTASFTDETKTSYFSRLLTTSSTAEICLQRDEKFEIGSCPHIWIPSDKTGISTFRVYRSATAIVDIKIPLTRGLSNGKLQVQLTEEFRTFRVYLFLLGVVLFVMAPILSQSLFFYYSSGMLSGVAFIALILPYKALRAPTIGKGLWYIMFFGFVTAIGSIGQFFWLFQAFRALHSLGVNGEAGFSVLVLSIVMLLAIGAGLGYWVTRSVVLTLDGIVDPAIAEFLKWVMRIMSVILLSQSSYDPEDSAFAILLVATASYLLHALLWRTLSEQRNACQQNDFDPAIGGDYGKDFIPAYIQEQVCVSTFHRSQRRRFQSSEEAARVSHACTQAALSDLVQSPEFEKWLHRNQ